MIDLRSDTLTMPGREMLETILSAPLGDSGRTDSEARGCDPTVSRLEDMAAQLTGKERAIFLPSGTMGNLTALLTHCGPNDEVLIDTRQHLYRTEKAAFEPKFGQLKPVFYHLTHGGWPDTDEIENLTSAKNAGYTEYRESQKREKELQTVKVNIETILRQQEPEIEQEHRAHEQEI